MHAGVVALVLTFAVLVASPIVDPAVAFTSPERRLCADRANLYDTPGGFVIGRLYKPARVRVLRRSANRRWLHVRTRSQLTGWIITGAVCRA